MSLEIHFWNIIVPKITLDSKYPGGAEQFKVDCPNKIFQEDEHLSSYSFMNEYDVDTFMDRLIKKGLNYDKAKNHSDDFVVLAYEVNGGLWWNVDWIEHDTEICWFVSKGKLILESRDSGSFFLRLSIVSEDFSVVLYNDSIEILNLERSSFKQVTLLESRLYSLFFVSQIISLHDTTSLLSNKFCDYAIEKIYREFFYYFDSKETLFKRIDLYNASVSVLRFNKDWIENTLIHYQDNLIKTELKKELSFKDVAETEIYNYNSSDIREFISKHKLNANQFKELVLELVAFEVSKNKKNLGQDSIAMKIRNEFESNNIFQGGYLLIKELSKLSELPEDSNPIFIKLHQIESLDKLKWKEIEFSKKYLKEHFNTIFKVRFFDRKKIGTTFYENRKDLGLFSDSVGNSVHLNFTVGELLQRYIELQSGLFTSTLKETMHYTDEMISSISNSLSLEETKFCEFILQDFYPNYLKGKFVTDSLDIAYGNLYGLRITDYMSNLFGRYTYCLFENDLDLLQYQRYFKSGNSSQKIIDTTNGLIDSDLDDLDDEDELDLESDFESDIDTNEIIKELMHHENAFNHLMGSINIIGENLDYAYPEPIRTVNVIDAIIGYIFQIENFKNLTIPIMEFSNTFRDPKILNAISQNFGLDLRNITYELIYRLNHYQKDLESQPIFSWKNEFKS
jgi:hypothetical protein